MGEAKRRGTPEERVAAAKANHQAVVDAVSTGRAQNYAFIFDRSTAGREAIDFIKRTAPDDIKARLETPAFQVWDATGFEFLVIWGTFGATGGLTVPTADIDALLSETLPAVMKRNNEVGGLCACSPAVAPEFRERIAQKLAELQPFEGTAQ
jgi:hypothetical protein